MASNPIGYNQEFPIYNADETPFNDLVLKKSVVDSVVMSLGDKVTGDVYYIDNTLTVNMSEYIVVDGVKYTLVNPPTIVREGMVSDNTQLNGMTKYSFVFYHPMYMLGNFPFTDMAVTQEESKYLSQNKTFSWIGTLFDLRDKINVNLSETEWYVEITIPHYEQDGHTETQQWKKASELSEVLSFDKQFISAVLKTAYEQWEIPFVIVSKTQVINGVTKKFAIQFGMPSQEIYDTDGVTPFVFKFGKGVGLKNNSRTPRNNKIITRLSGSGSERNVPFGYPQIIWTGDQSWSYTINNAEGMQPIEIGGQTVMAMSYPIYDGIVGGQRVRLIKHPFTRTTLMPSIYSETVNRKVNPNAAGYNPNTVIVDYYDSSNINPLAPSYDAHQFEDIYPRLGNVELVQVMPYDDITYISRRQFELRIDAHIENASNYKEVDMLNVLYYSVIEGEEETISGSETGGSYTYSYEAHRHTYEDGYWYDVKYTSNKVNFKYNVYLGNTSPNSSVDWDDSVDDEGNYKQSYFKIKIPQLSFDLYASAAVTEEMTVNMRSGSCIGCSFKVQVDWEDYKKNFYDENGNFAPDGEQRNLNKYPKSQNGQITLTVQKDNETFGTLMPNIYQQPQAGDEFVILGISIPTSYITSAESELDDAMREYLLENGIYYYDYPLKFDEHFLATHQDILQQMHNNSIVRFQYAGVDMALYIKQITIKYGEKPLPQYDITLTDDIEIVLNQIGQVTDDVSRMRVQVSELQKYYSESIVKDINSKLSRIADDICQGRITFQKGLNSIGNIILSDEIRSNQYQSGLYDGRGWKIDALGNAELESLRVRTFLEVVELIINRLQAQEGDTLFTDNDQIDKVEMEVNEVDQSVTYLLSLKEKYDGYITSQMYGNIVKGIINTLAAKEAGVSDESQHDIQNQGHDDGGNLYYTSWMRVVDTHNTDPNLGVNQVRVVLYGDDQVPSGTNFEPCELMTIARWGCVDYSNPDDPNYETVKESIERRQRVFMISTSEGRVVKYSGVDSPILREGNYGVTLGELPDFVKRHTEVRKILDQVGEHSDWLYAQGVVVGNYVHIDRVGLPVPVIVFCGEWLDGSTLANPTPKSGIYFYNEYNEESLQFEIHEVRHDSGRWQCLQHQPVRQGGVDVYYEPKWNSPYWRLVDGNENLSIEFSSSRGFSFRRGFVDTVITAYLFYGNVDITEDVAAQYWSWTRHEERNEDAQGNITYTEQDRSWNAQHQRQKTLHLTNDDMPSSWSSSNKAIFTCTVVVNDGKTTRTTQNQIIS